MQESQIGKGTIDLTDHSMSGTAHTYYIHTTYIRTYTNMCHNAGKYIGPYLVKCLTMFLTLRNAKMCPFSAEVLLQQQQRTHSRPSKYHTSFTEHTGQI